MVDDDDMKTFFRDKSAYLFGRSANPFVLLLGWWLIAGIIMPIVFVLISPRDGCSDPFIPKLITFGSTSGTILIIYIVATLFAGILLLFVAFTVRPLVRAVATSILVVLVSGWVLAASIVMLLMLFYSPYLADEIAINDHEYVLITCSDGDWEGGRARLYRCDDERRRACYLVTEENYGLAQEPELRLEGDRLIIDDLLFFQPYELTIENE